MRYQGGFGVITGHDAEHPAAGFWQKCFIRREHRLRLHQHFAHQRLQLKRPLGRIHAAGGAYQQRVVEQLTQTLEAIAHRGLGNAQLVGRPGHTQLPQQHIQIFQQVEINPPYVHTLSRQSSRPNIRVNPTHYKYGKCPLDS